MKLSNLGPITFIRFSIYATSDFIRCIVMAELKITVKQWPFSDQIALIVRAKLP